MSTDQGQGSDAAGAAGGPGAGKAAGAAGDLAKAGVGVATQPHNPAGYVAAFKALLPFLKMVLSLGLYFILVIGTMLLSLIFSFNGANPYAAAQACGGMLGDADVNGVPIGDTSGRADSKDARGASPGSSFESLGPEAKRNAELIIAIGKSMGVSDRGQIVALATAGRESNLLNLSYGDRDSLGLFQQRPSQGWGTPSQILNTKYATTKFYTALKKVGGWESMPVTVAAQKVQNSFYPDAYAEWEPLARELHQRITGTVTPNQNVSYAPTNDSIDCGAIYGTSTGLVPGSPYCVGGNESYKAPTAGTCDPKYTISLPSNPKRAAAIAFAFAQLGEPYVYGANGPNTWDCSSLTQQSLKAAGITVPRVASAQYQWSGTQQVQNVDQLAQGDLVFAGGLGHVGMYLGNGYMIHAPHSGERVKIAKIYSGITKYGVMPYDNAGGSTKVNTASKTTASKTKGAKQ